MRSLLLLHHQGLGDNIICNGMINEFAKQYDTITVFCKDINEASISSMYSYSPKIKIKLVKNDEEAFNFIQKYGSNFSKVLIVGFNFLDINSNIKFDEQFYIQAGIDFERKWDSFFIGRDIFNEKLILENCPDNFVFIHEDVDRQMIINDKFLVDKKIIKADPEKTKNIFNYCSAIEQASEIHVIDSCFMFLVDCMKYINKKQKLFVHRYCRQPIGHLLPSLRKEWNIITF
jgi:hypothetical protein